MKTEEKKKELLQEAKIKIKIYKALLEAIEENGGIFDSNQRNRRFDVSKGKIKGNGDKVR